MRITSIKNILTFAIAAAFILSVSNFAYAADKQEVKIKTSATCGACKTTIEGGLKSHNGIIKSNLDLDDKYVTVSFDAEVTSPDDIRLAIAKLGYDADEVKSVKKDCSGKTMKECSDKTKKDCSSKCSKLKKSTGCSKVKNN